MPALSAILPDLKRRASSIRQRIRTISTTSNSSVAAPSSYQPYSVHHQTSSYMAVPPALNVLQTPEVGQKVLDTIVESPNGRRGLSRLARTCRALLDPALDVLWRELDSLIPLIGLFPSNLLRKTKKPGLGLATPPSSDRDWAKVLSYGARVQRITYDEISNNVSPTIFPILEDLRPRTYILPNLESLTWRITSPENLDRAGLFLSPGLQHFTLNLGLAGTRFPTLPAFLADLGGRMKLKSFSFTAATPLPDGFTEMMAPQDTLERLALLAPGALSPAVGKWVTSLPQLKSLQLDLSKTGPNGFFRDVPEDIDFHTDSGIFSAEDEEYGHVRKGRSSGPFPALTHLHLTGSVGSIGAFLGHISTPVTQLELVIEDPPDAKEWQNFSGLLSDRFGDSLVSLKMTATLSSRFGELHLSALPLLRVISIDLPESTLFTKADVVHLGAIAPNLEEVRLCPLARFAATTPPVLTLEDLVLLIHACPNLTSLAVVVNAKSTNTELPVISNSSLLWLHVGHSWIAEPLQTAILLSQFGTDLSVKWFSERTRPGFVENNARGWAKVMDILPHLQNLRLVERKAAAQRYPPPAPIVIVQPPPPPEKVVEIEYVEVVAPRPPMVDKAIDATVTTAECGVEARPEIVEMSVQAVPETSSCEVQATPEHVSIAVDATPEVKTTAVDATVNKPARSSAGVQTAVPKETTEASPTHSHGPSLTISFASVLTLVAMVRAMVLAPFLIPMRVASTAVGIIKGKPKGGKGGEVELDNVEPQRETESERPEIARWVPRASVAHVTTRTRVSFLNLALMSERKQEKDFTTEVDAALPQAAALAKEGKLEPALDQLLVLEKQTRNAADLASTSRLAKAIVQHCYDARNYDLLNANVSLLSKKHGQLKAAIQAIVELVMGWLDEVKKSAGTDKWLELVQTLRTVTEGKIFLETPRARVTLMLAKHHESLAGTSTKTPVYKDNMTTASELLSDLQVETYSSMDRREKTEFILEQMRLLVAVARLKDAEIDAKTGKEVMAGGESEWIKVRVGGRKINEEFLKEKENEDLKLKYYDLMIQHALHASSYLDVAKYYHKVWETPSIKEDEGDQGKAALEHIVYYIVLAPHSNEQSDMLHRLYNDPALLKLELHYNLVKCFVTRELMRWPGIESLYGKFLRQTPVFSAEKRWEDLHTRVIEHNVRVVAEYYSRITLPRLTSLLDLDQKQTEQTIARLVVAGTIWARIDRPAGIVNFRSPRTAEDVMNDWSSDMQKLLAVVEKTWMGMNAAQAASSRVKA
ncbi:hypothetical protein HMN09_00908100 [Mycena chlorophos]|uniref:PCI domain-containing protein n=1 Tax=Mycena chlorophos TaxID=658473 RepID=A0A8H6W2M9_MYCCL|nr:hypothetical protein HMN09_00908100 [Mycena chlorophos]